MISREHMLWEVDTQADFLLPGGKLYAPGAEKWLPNIRRLTDEARQDRVFLVSHGCFHFPDDPEFQKFPPHCVKGTPGAEFVPEALADQVARVPNDASATIPEDLFSYQQILLEKQTLDIFGSRHAEALLDRVGEPEFYVFGVVTEFCVNLAASGLMKRGRRVVLVKDAITALDQKAGDQALAELRSLGARIVSTDAALAAIRQTHA
ncbi:MAG TPA: isochorismatase family protein [Candidatus Sulfotelmatobacter sp.]